MDHSPFAFFRKYQRAGMAAVTIMAMFAFVFLDTTGAGRSSNWFGGGAPIAVSLRGGNLTEQQLVQLQQSREIANQFLQMAVGESSNFEKLPPAEQNQVQQKAMSLMFGFGMSDTNWRQDVVFGEVLRREAHRIGLTVSDAAIEQFISRATENKLTSAQFQTVLKAMQIAPKSLYDCLRAELLSQQAFHISRPFFNATPEQYWQYYRQLKVEQTITLAELPVAEFTADIEAPADRELRSYFEAHKLRYPRQAPDFAKPGFRQPNKTQVQYLSISYEEVEKRIPEITDQEIAAHYEKNKATLYRDLTPDEETETPAQTPPAAPGDKTGPVKPEGTAPEGDKPATEKPATEAPATEAPAEPTAEDKPATEAPAEEKPATEAPAAEDKPAEDKPAEDKSQSSACDVPQNAVTLVTFQEETPATETPAAEAQPATEAPAVEAPATEKPATEAPATEEQPATEKGPGLPAPPTVPGAPVETPAADKAPEKPIKYKPLADVKEEIRDGLLAEKTDIEARKIIDEVATKMGEIGYKYNTPPYVKDKTIYLDFNTNDTIDADEPSVESKTAFNPDEIPEALQRELTLKKVAMVEVELQALAKSTGLKYGASGLISPDELQEIPGLGDVIDLEGNDFQEGGRKNILETLFASESLYTPSKGNATINEEADGTSIEQYYAFWEVNQDTAHVAKFEDPGIKEQVIAAWKLEKAYELAVKRATDLVQRANNNKDKPLGEVLKDQTVSRAKDSAALVVATTNPFTWMSTPAPGMQANPFQTPPPSPTKINFVEEPGVEFYQAACEDLQVGETGFAPDYDHTHVYVIRVDSRSPAPGPELEKLRETFLKERLFGISFMQFDLPTSYDQLRRAEEQRLIYEWSQELRARYNIRWTDPNQEQ